MFTSKMPGFCKNEDCPTSHELLDFQKSESPNPRGSEISRHLASCEFCSAEVEFYSRYPQDETIGEATAIPAPLYELAEALLKHRHTDASSLNSLLNESKDLIFDKV